MFTFEYGMKPISELLQMQDIDMAKITHFPFQNQIQFTGLDGSKYLRVITQKMEISNEREELQSVADAEMMRKNVLMQGAKLARYGNSYQAQAYFKTYNRRTKKLEGKQWESSRAEFQM